MFNVLANWYGLQYDENGVLHLSIAEFSLWFTSTKGYYKKIPSPNELQKTLGLEGQRAYKRVVIDSENENVVGMYHWYYDKHEAVWTIIYWN